MDFVWKMDFDSIQREFQTFNRWISIFRHRFWSAVCYSIHFQTWSFVSLPVFKPQTPLVMTSQTRSQSHIFKMIATSGFLTALECIEVVLGRRSDRDPGAWGSLHRSSGSLAGLSGPTSTGE